jgi:hypothetical protein
MLAMLTKGMDVGDGKGTKLSIVTTPSTIFSQPFSWSTMVINTAQFGNSTMTADYKVVKGIPVTYSSPASTHYNPSTGQLTYSMPDALHPERLHPLCPCICRGP